MSLTSKSMTNLPDMELDVGLPDDSARTDPGAGPPTDPGGPPTPEDSETRVVAESPRIPVDVVDPANADEVLGEHESARLAAAPERDANVADTGQVSLSGRNALAYEGIVHPPAPRRETPAPEESIVVRMTPPGLGPVPPFVDGRPAAVAAAPFGAPPARLPVGRGGAALAQDEPTPIPPSRRASRLDLEPVHASLALDRTPPKPFRSMSDQIVAEQKRTEDTVPGERRARRRAIIFGASAAGGVLALAGVLLMLRTLPNGRSHDAPSDPSRNPSRTAITSAEPAHAPSIPPHEEPASSAPSAELSPAISPISPIASMGTSPPMPSAVPGTPRPRVPSAPRNTPTTSSASPASSRPLSPFQNLEAPTIQ